MTGPSRRFGDVVADTILTIPPEVHAGGRGWCAAVASILEVAAAKPGNVHPGAEFDDLAFDDFVRAARAIARPIDAAAALPLGESILTAAKAAAAVTTSNANLGIILLVAPLAAVPKFGVLTAADVEPVLAQLDATDAAAIWKAIGLARPGGLGKVARHDLAGPPPSDIRAAMALAAERDAIAALWAHGFEPLFAGPVADIANDLVANVSLEAAIIRAHIRQLARQPDSLITRRHGPDASAEVSARAATLVARETDPDWHEAVARFDAALRSPRRINPGTTADLIAAALYILLRDGRLRTDFLPAPTP